MKTLIVLLFASLFSFAEDMPQWLADIYDHNNKYFELECTYFNPADHKTITPITETTKTSLGYSRKFKIQTPNTSAELTFFLSRIDKKNMAEIYINDSLYYTKRIKRTRDREFYLPWDKDGLKIETQDIFCEVNFAENVPSVINGDTHLNIHPHVNYDPKKLTAPGAELLFKELPSKIMLEDGNMKGNNADLDDFLTDGSLWLYQGHWVMTDEYRNYVEYVVSPAGHNRFVWETTKPVEIHYTGGNHNYCIWNNARNLLRAYLKSYSDAPVIINYHMDAIVAQWGGIISGLSFSKSAYNKSPLIKNLLGEENEDALDYVKAYHNYFAYQYIDQEFLGYVKTLKVKTIFKDQVLERTVKGTGTLDREIIFNYLD
tara:strand:+ start:39236 stop:40354 length:1119 start_codon:yes stop_codon:yes gene_type:complete